MTEEELKRAWQLHWIDQALAFVDQKAKSPGERKRFEQWTLDSLAYIARNMMWHAQAAHWMMRLENARRHAVKENA